MIRSSDVGGWIVQSRTLRWLRAASSSICQPRSRSAVAFRLSAAVTSRPFLGQPFGGRPISEHTVTIDRSSEPVLPTMGSVHTSRSDSMNGSDCRLSSDS